LFERDTERARCVIFFARYEASQYGSHLIETEHLLLGLLREDYATVRKCPPEEAALAANIQAEIARRITVAELISTSIEVLLPGESKKPWRSPRRPPTGLDTDGSVAA
jgi:ATP-dependent Clp protease ATP-binding subunit ClpC